MSEHKKTQQHQWQRSLSAWTILHCFDGGGDDDVAMVKKGKAITTENIVRSLGLLVPRLHHIIIIQFVYLVCYKRGPCIHCYCMGKL